MRLEFHEELSKYSLCLPVMKELAQALQQSNALKDIGIGWHCHLTEITAAAADAVIAGGGKIYMSECNPETTSHAAVDYMRSRGAVIYLGSDSCSQVLKHRPKILCDTGFVLCRAYLDSREDFVHAASEITTSGITELRRLSPPLSVVNINQGALKHFIENFHGVGDGVVDLLSRLTGRLLSGRTATVIGYGAVGSGVAHYLRKAGCAVLVVDSDPVRKLVAHYDGYPLASKEKSLSESEVIVTATGAPAIIQGKEWLICRDGAIIVNVGHWSSELDLRSLAENSTARKQIGEHFAEYELRNGKTLRLVAEGEPANVVTLAGSPEPTLIHLTTEVLTMAYLAKSAESGSQLPPGEIPLPTEVEMKASALALKALGYSD